MLININSVTKYYNQTRALDNVNLEISKGKIIGLLGPNGSGKTTLIKIICGLLKKYTGEVLVNGEKICVFSRKNIAYLPDKEYLPTNLMVKDAIKVYTSFFEDFNKEKCEKLLSEFSIDLNKKIGTLSKGNKEKLQLILTISREVDLYIFDEPIAGVDPASRDIIFEIILNHFKKGATLIVSTHLVYDIQDILDEVIFVKNGQIMLHQDKASLVKEYGKEVDLIFREVFRYV